LAAALKLDFQIRARFSRHDLLIVREAETACYSCRHRRLCSIIHPRNHDVRQLLRSCAPLWSSPVASPLRRENETVMIRHLIACCCPALLVGCVTAYVPPTDSNSASLTLETIDSRVSNLWFYHYPGGFDAYRCSATPAEAIAILHNVSIATLYADKGKNVSSVTVKIPAGAPFRFATNVPSLTGIGAAGIKWQLCQPHIRFTPLPAGQYVAVHGVGGDFCTMELFSINDTGRLKPVPYEKLPVCYDPKNDGGGWKSPVEERFNRDPSAYK
jgi:hypothetical protein